MTNRPLHKKLATLASVLMALIYLGGGIFLIASSLSFSFLPVGSLSRYAMAALLIVYGAYRAYRALKSSE